MKFCQTDGTVLIENAPAADPYKTVVGNQSDIAGAIPPLDPFKTMVAIPPPKAAEDDLLQLPEESDNLKTMVISQNELREEIKGEEVPPLDLPPPTYAPSAPLIEPKPPTPNDFSSAPSAVNAGLPKPSEAFPSDAPVVKNPSGSQGSSPFDSKPFENDFSTQSPYGNQENKPIPSPFQDSLPPGYQPPAASPFDAPPASPFDAPTPPSFKEPDSPFGASPESATQLPFQPPTPFGQPESFNAQMEQTGWTPPPAPNSEWGNQDLGANTPFQPPAAGVGQNQTLAVVSLVLGILSFICGGIFLAIPAIVTGYMQKNNIKNNPAEYGGGALANIGMIIGIVNVVLTVVVIIIYIILIAANL